MPAPEDVIALIERFERNREAYLSGQYNETQLRREFLDPLFTALGWDVDNKQGYAEAYKDVIHEDALKIGSAVKAPDYCFRIGGTRKFFVEAKKPSVNLKADINPAFQLRRYAWSAKLPLSILTDFEEFAVYDCRIKPIKTDKASTARVLYLTYKDYVQRWDEISSVFTRDSVLKGSFDKYAEKGRHKKGTAEVDAAFLAEIEAWRDILARNIALRNEGLTQRELNFSVQRTIDRIIFLRICEDRGIEEYGRLMALLNGTNIYKRLFQIFRNADERYNSGLFHFEKEKDRHEFPDDLTPSLDIDDKILKDMIGRLYYPESPYEFSVLPADILGQVYEQFLGKVIRLTEGHRAVVEEKPEVRKAGGVYYTPTYIVDYIVKNTVGHLVGAQFIAPIWGNTARKPGAMNHAPTNITPKEVSKLRIIDPACGSGSFLLGAYQYLLDWHRDWYASNDPQKWASSKHPALYQAQGNEWRLTTAERKRILLNNIYGVDIDSQAVEVTKLSLLLKVLEGENNQTLERQMKFFHERALPDLGDNIKCGNSLIGPDFYQQQTMLDEEERYRINVFDWNAEFPQIMKAGGFDAVIGNPPYVYRNSADDMLQAYYREKYKNTEGNYDLYKFFVERGIALLKHRGLLGMIISATFMIQTSFKKLRHFILTSTIIQRLAPLGPKVFMGATVDTAILVAERGSFQEDDDLIVQAPANPTSLANAALEYIPQKRFVTNDDMVFDYRLSKKGAQLVKRLFEKYPPIEKGYEFGVGINTGYIKQDLVADNKIDDRYHPMVAGNGISRYGAVNCSGWIMYDADYVRSRGKLGRSLPGEHFLKSEKILIVRTRNLSLSRRLVATIDTSRAYNLNRLSNIVARPNYSIAGLLAILNSSLFNWLYSTRFFDYEIKPIYLRKSPLANSNSPQLIKYVEQMLSLNKQLASAKTAHEKTALQRQVDATDKQIDKLVYELYGLTEEEIKIVEGGR